MFWKKAINKVLSGENANTCFFISIKAPLGSESMKDFKNQLLD